MRSLLRWLMVSWYCACSCLEESSRFRSWVLRFYISRSSSFDCNAKTLKLSSSPTLNVSRLLALLEYHNLDASDIYYCSGSFFTASQPQAISGCASHICSQIDLLYSLWLSVRDNSSAAMSAVALYCGCISSPITVIGSFWGGSGFSNLKMCPRSCSISKSWFWIQVFKICSCSYILVLKRCSCSSSLVFKTSCASMFFWVS